MPHSCLTPPNFFIGVFARAQMVERFAFCLKLRYYCLPPGIQVKGFIAIKHLEHGQPHTRAAAALLHQYDSVGNVILQRSGEGRATRVLEPGPQSPPCTLIRGTC